MDSGEVIPVKLAGESYDITVRPGLLAEAGSIVRGLTKSAKAIIVTDSHVGPLHVANLAASLASAGLTSITVTIPAGEDHKTLADLLPAYDRILPAGIERSTPILALGGGVIGDMAGFLASTLLRGVPFVQIPTTLLAMVDASVGGKTGVNHSTGKNLIGAFHQPIAVLIDPATLKTLPPDQIRSGLAECIKHDIIRDQRGFEHLENNIQRALNLDIAYLTELIAHNVAIKARVVEQDQFEHGERAHLNFGHTFGHAIETVSHYSYSHGECVAMGMTAASFMAQRLKMIDEPQYKRIVSVIEKTGLPTRGLKLDTAAVVGAMSHDKKVKSGKLRFILPDKIGHVIIRDDVPADLVTAAVESLKG